MSYESAKSHRKERDRIFKQGVTSPLTEEQKACFTGLTYYDYNPSLDIRVEITRFKNPESIIVQTTKDETKEYQRYGEFTFTHSGQQVRLTLYKAPFGFFIPFVDQNAGKETYPAGRYLDPEHIDGNTFHVDFNLVYNPLCAYNNLWNCPVTPEENRIDVSIRAGEKNPDGPWLEKK